jgi:hypothetical protein
MKSIGCILLRAHDWVNVKEWFPSHGAFKLVGYRCSRCGAKHLDMIFLQTASVLEETTEWIKQEL